MTLACTGLSAGYAGLAVARGVDLSVGPKQIIAVLGPNGAGKTTLLLTLAGFLAPIGGSVLLDGEVVRRPGPGRMNAAGVVLVPDSRALFMNLTPLENLTLAARRSPRDTGRKAVDEVLDIFPSLRARLRLATGMLSGGEQQMLAVGRALVQRPRVLLIDEMSMGLAPIIVEHLMPLIRGVADEAGAGVVLVEQHVHLALEVADHAMVMFHGDVTLSGSPSELRADQAALEAAYLGSRTCQA